MEAWKKSPIKQDFLRVVGAMGKSCANSASNFDYNPDLPLVGLSPAMASLHGSLRQMLEWLEKDIPPLEDSAAKGGAPFIRFGNPAFKTWHTRLQQRSVNIVKEIYLIHQQSTTANNEGLSLEKASERGYQAAATDGSNDECPPFLKEMSCYLHDAFGHPIRLDYGTGHESSFMVVLYAACKLGWMDETIVAVENQPPQPPSMDKLKATTLSIFHAYLRLTRQLQMKYRLEPAGSHGVWGLDDYHCLPFYFGACQCQAPVSPNDEFIEEMPVPSDITLEQSRKRYSKTLLYFGCMDYICTLKRGAPLFECSPMLYDISQTCPSWSKVASGLIKLYEGEVLNKRQVVQHFTFGEHLFKATWKATGAAPPAPPTTTTFRTTATAAVPLGAGVVPPLGAVAPMIRAPWAADGGGGAAAEIPMGKAPWASNNKDNTTDSGAGGEHPNMPPPTKAPWAT